MSEEIRKNRWDKERRKNVVLDCLKLRRIGE